MQMRELHESKVRMKDLLAIHPGGSVKGSNFLHIPAPLAENLRSGLVIRMRDPDALPEPMALIAGLSIPSHLHLDFLGCNLPLLVPRSAEGGITGFTTFSSVSEVSRTVNNGQKERVSFISVNAGVPAAERAINLGGYVYPLQATDVFGTLHEQPFNGIKLTVETPEAINLLTRTASAYTAIISSGDVWQLDSLSISLAVRNLLIRARADSIGGSYESFAEILETGALQGNKNDAVELTARFVDGALSQVIVSDSNSSRKDVALPELGDFLKLVGPRDFELLTRVLDDMCASGFKTRLQIPFLLASLANHFVDLASPPVGSYILYE